MGVEKSRVLIDNLKLSQTDINYGYEWRVYDDGVEQSRYTVSDAVNRRLRTAGIKLVEGKPYEIPDDFKRYAQIMLDYQLGQAFLPGQFEDHNVCGLYSDLTPDSEEATIGRARYFDMLRTFSSFPYLYRNDETHAIEHRGSDYIHNDFGVLYPLSLHRGANPIGANTIAVTADNKMLIARQDEHAHVNPGRLMPSGSGTASWHDYVDIDAKVLQDIIKHCAEYKLRLECSLPSACELDSHVLGMCRVPIGMKPDFFCWTQLSMTADELVAAGANPYDIVEARDGEESHLSDALISYIEKKNAEAPGSVSLQLYLEAMFLAEVCR